MELKKKLVLAICSGNIVILAIFLWAWIKKMLDITRQQVGKKRLKDNYLTAEGLPKF